MRHEYRRCAHCRVVFLYQTSGRPMKLSPGQSPDSRYCADCHAVVESALHEVPMRVERVMVDVTDPEERAKIFAEHERRNAEPDRVHFGPVPVLAVEDRAQLIEKWSLDGDDKWEASSVGKFIDDVLKAAAPKGLGIPIRQIGSSLFKMDGPNIVDSMHTHIFPLGGKTYHVSTWAKGSSPPEIKVEMERNLETHELTPWGRCQ